MALTVKTDLQSVLSFGDALRSGERNDATRMLAVLLTPVQRPFADFAKALEFFGFDMIDISPSDHIAIYEAKRMPGVWARVSGSLFDDLCIIEWSPTNEVSCPWP